MTIRDRLALDQLSLASSAGVSTARRRFDLVDHQRRVVRYLRVSLTDRCNYRCTYCMPAQGVDVVPRDDLLRFEEIERLVRVFVSMGVTHVRLTGGEPLTRRDVVDLVGRVARIPGVEDLAMTTNGHMLSALAAPLRAAGLARLNVSLDTLDSARFQTLTRGGALKDVLAGLDAAAQAGFAPIKINAVVLRDGLDRDPEALLRFAQSRGLLLRFIEYMPIGVDDHWGPDTFVSAAELRDTLSARGWRFRANSGDVPVGGGPATYWMVDAPGGPRDVPVGFIHAVSDHFCERCNRVRLSPTGRLRECLSAEGALSLRDMLRAGCDDIELTAAIRSALLGKVDGHRYWEGGRTCQSMVAIGG